MIAQLKNLVRKAANHPARHVVHNSLLMVLGTRMLQMRGTTTGAMNQAEVMHGWAKQVIEAIEKAGIDVAGAKMTEVGPGHSLGVAVALLLAGAAEVWAVDVKRFADPSDPEAVRPVAEYCKTHGLGLMNGNGQTLDLLKVLKRIRYAIVHDDGRRPVADGCMDVVYSYFSGEHLRSPRGVLTETSQALRPGGICIHAIDLRDHIHRENNWLEFLYYDQWLWEAMTSRRGHWTNRLLSPQWRKLFEEQFEIVTFHEGRKPVPPEFDPSKVAAAFREYQLEMLSVDYLWVVARKPA